MFGLKKNDKNTTEEGFIYNPSDVTPKKHLLIFIPGEGLENITTDDLIREVKDMGYEVELKETTKDGDKIAHEFRVDNVKVMVTGPVKLPPGHKEYDIPTQLAWWWKESEAAMSKADSYYVIIVDTNIDDVLAQHMLASHFTAGILQSNPRTIGVLWGRSNVLHSKFDFVKTLSKGVSFNLWVYYKIGKFPDGDTGVATVGLTAFNIPELEISSKGKYKVNELYSLATYLTNYNVSKMSLKNGETISGPKGDKGTISYEKPGFELQDREKVMRIRFE